eukprot:255959-Amphidinium_carterae.4
MKCEMVDGVFVLVAHNGSTAAALVVCPTSVVRHSHHKKAVWQRCGRICGKAVVLNRMDWDMEVVHECVCGCSGIGPGALFCVAGRGGAGGVVCGVGAASIAFAMTLRCAMICDETLSSCRLVAGTGVAAGGVVRGCGTEAGRGCGAGPVVAGGGEVEVEGGGVVAGLTWAISM